MSKADREGLGFNYQQEKLKNLSLHNVESVFSDSIAANENPFTAEEGGDEHFQKVASANHQSTKVRNKTEMLQNQEKVLMKKVTARTFEVQKLEEEFELLKAAAEMVFDEEHVVDFYLEQLNHQMDSRKNDIMKLESDWEAFRKPLDEKRIDLEDSLFRHMPEAQGKLQKLKEVDLEKQSILSEIRRWEEEYSQLCLDLEKQSGLPSRASYIERIKEITKSSQKQDADIERILKETREVQLESNSIQDRLHRTYAVLDEIMFREAKREPLGRQAYRLLTSIHECFEQISEKVLAIDRTRREIAEHEKKLTAMTSRSLKVDKLEADLDTIRKENEELGQQLEDK